MAAWGARFGVKCAVQPVVGLLSQTLTRFQTGSEAGSMIQNRGRTQEHDGGCTITMLASSGARSALICLAGDIDQSASERLCSAADWLAAVAPASVLIDLGAVTFAGAALPNFVARAYGALPDGSALALCRARPMTRRVLELTGMERIATLREHLPASPALVNQDTDIF